MGSFAFFILSFDLIQTELREPDKAAVFCHRSFGEGEGFGENLRKHLLLKTV